MEQRSGKVVRGEDPVGSKRQKWSASTGEDVRHGRSRDSKKERQHWRESLSILLESIGDPRGIVYA
jgi:hypothetical protein